METTGSDSPSPATPHSTVTADRADLSPSVLAGRSDDDQRYMTDLLADLGASTTPYHAVQRTIERLAGAGFQLISLADTFPTNAGAFMVANGGTVAAWIQPDTATDAISYTVVGAHTDSPNLRIKGNADIQASGYHQLNLEVYGGVLINSWLNRDLGLAGRVVHESGGGELSEMLVSVDAPILTIPQLAIHLDRDVNRNGLVLNPQKHLKPIWALDAASGENGSNGQSASTASDDGNTLDERGRFVSFLGEVTNLAPDQVLSWDLMAFDLQAPSLIGQAEEFIASARIDNLLSSFAATHAMIEHADSGDATEVTSIPVMVLYDHEEVGSESSTGAGGSFLVSLLERIGAAVGQTRSEFLASCHRSLVVSADGAHATHPNYPDRHDATHTIELNRGVVIKRNANQRYATEAMTESFIRSVCRERDIPHQLYHHRNDLPCGSTIGPITAARLGVSTVDLGAPQLSMHSIRETAGTLDAIHLRDLLLGVWMDRTTSR